MKRALPWKMIPCSLLLCAAINAMAVVQDSEIEQRVVVLSRQLRCLVCQNETLADSRADLASDLRNQIREQMEAGKTDREIIKFLTDRYGDFVLYRPPIKPTTYVLWFGPFLLFIGGFVTLYRCLTLRSSLLKDRTPSAEERKRAAKLLGQHEKAIA
jgi:cytochrome c-type biogenesis protein CcmH